VFHGLHLTRARSNTRAFDALAVDVPAPDVLALEVLALEVLALEVLALEVLALEVLDAALPRGVEHAQTDQPADCSMAALPDGFFFDAPFLAIA
jgi:hypothetical protein